MTPRLFLDLDGVLADFNRHYEECFGVRPNQDTYDPPGFWDCIRSHGSFYRDQPLMEDAMDLWNAVKHLNPTILSGIPYSIPNVAIQKRLWVNKHIGVDVRLICCFSKDKRTYGRPGDVLVDDRLKYAHHWLEMGGVFIHHRSAQTTIAALAGLPGNPFDVLYVPQERCEGAG